uniref:Uncharacterized protein n=1 Tax=Esox lucius TaxID=8010 RepID=A0AAY5KSS9_ESOLU
TVKMTTLIVHPFAELDFLNTFKSKSRSLQLAVHVAQTGPDTPHVHPKDCIHSGTTPDQEGSGITRTFVPQYDTEFFSVCGKELRNGKGVQFTRLMGEQRVEEQARRRGPWYQLGHIGLKYTAEVQGVGGVRHQA